MGGAVNELGWKYIQLLSAGDQAKVMDALFGTDAAHFGIVRIPMSASDYAIARYSDDEVASGMDLNLTSFSITEDQKYLIPYVKAALAVNPSLRFWASPWTPPTWMKTFTGNSTNGTSCAIFSQTSNITPTPPTDMSPFDGGCMSSDASILTTYSNFFVKWVQAYAQQNITIEAVSPQNEPNYPENYPSAVWGSDVEDTFVAKYLGPALKTASLSTYVMAGTMSNNTSGKDETNLTTLLGDATAKGFIKVAGYQWGMQQYVAADLKTYGIPIWQTEHRCGNYPFSGVMNPTPSDSFNANGAANDIGYGVETWELIRGWINDGVSAYNAWNMVLDTVGKGIDVERNWPQDALITVNTSSNTFTLTPAYYVFRHVSQYAQAGGKVLNTTSTLTAPSSAMIGGDEVLAFQNPDNSISVVMYNPGSAGNFIVSVGGKLIQFAMPAQGWATLVYVPS
jgi:glucosylceramidase